MPCAPTGPALGRKGLGKRQPLLQIISEEAPWLGAPWGVVLGDLVDHATFKSIPRFLLSQAPHTQTWASGPPRESLAGWELGEVSASTGSKKDWG